MQKSNRPVQRRGAEALQREVGIPMNRPCGLEDVPAFERVMDARIIVFGAAQGNAVIYPPKNQCRVQDKTCYHVQLVPPERGRGPGHFNAVINPKGFLAFNHNCNMCLKGHSHGKKHRCIDTCQKCRQTSCEPGDPTTCRDCNVTCVSNACYLKHKSGSKSACDILGSGH